MFFDTTQFEPKKITNLFEAFKWYTSEYGNTAHMTIIFNTFGFVGVFIRLSKLCKHNIWIDYLIVFYDFVWCIYVIGINS